jgi:hypothetical protein
MSHMSSIEAKLYVGMLTKGNISWYACYIAHSVFCFCLGYLPQKSCHESCQQRRACVWHPQLVYKRNTCSVQTSPNQLPKSSRKLWRSIKMLYKSQMKIMHTKYGSLKVHSHAMLSHLGLKTYLAWNFYVKLTFTLNIITLSSIWHLGAT